MKKIFLLTDYQGRFGSKAVAQPHRSGMDKTRLKKYFFKQGLEAVFLPFCKVDLRENYWIGMPVVYCSSEDEGLHYKSYIEDVCLGLELRGARLIPPYKYLRAHHNKVFMEMLRDLAAGDAINSISSTNFGCLEDFDAVSGTLEYPLVIKSASGAGSTSVYLAETPAEARTKVKKASRSRNWKNELHEIARSFKYKGLVRDSKHRHKFIVQNLISGLANDWKVLVFGEKYYVLRRDVRPGDFRASGSGRLFWEQDVPDEVCNFAKSVFKELDLPNVSLDVAWDGKTCHLIEFQALYFGSLTLDKAAWHFVHDGEEWRRVSGTSFLEEEYAASIVKYLESRIS